MRQDLGPGSAHTPADRQTRSARGGAAFHAHPWRRPSLAAKASARRFGKPRLAASVLGAVPMPDSTANPLRAHSGLAAAAPATVQRDRWRSGLWRLADPKISITSAAALLVGTAVAVHAGAFAPGWLAITALALFCMEVAKNAWGDVIDYDSGTDLAVAPEDRTDFSGGKRVLVDGLLTRAQTWSIAAAFAAVGIGLGAVIVFWREPEALWIGLFALVLGWSYHGPPLRLVYRGFGELVVVLCYGPLMVVSTTLIQTQQWLASAVWVSVPLGLMIAAFLWVNEFPDYRADQGAGKRNLVVLLGRQRASRTLPWIYLTAFAVLALTPGVTGLPRAAWAGFLAVPFAVYACWQTWQHPTDFHRTHPVQPAALIAFNAYALGSSIGIMVG